jgi:hypothetical protein
MQSYYDRPNDVDIGKVMKSITRESIIKSQRGSTRCVGDGKFILAPKDLNHLWDINAGVDNCLRDSDGGYLDVVDGYFPPII